MTCSLVEKHRLGMITDHQLVVESLHMLDPRNPGVALTNLPEPILRQVLRFAKDYRRDQMMTNYGVVPTLDQVLAAESWITESRRHLASLTA
ncbi:MAG: hypothetical protein L0Y71_10125 [Gemmataceae bacterium]|nr:hypothetical protein [Gemmataceae bacterium]